MLRNPLLSFRNRTRRKAPKRRDSIHRRVSTSADQSTLDLEEEVFSPPIKLAESVLDNMTSSLEKKRSLRSRHSIPTDSDSSYSNISTSSPYPAFPFCPVLHFTPTPILTRSRSRLQDSLLTNDSEDTELNSVSALASPKAPLSTEVVRVDDSLLCEEEDFDEELDDETYSCCCFPFLICRMIIIKTLPPYDSLDSSLKQTHLLPPKDPNVSPYTLVLDLDETLVHCVMEPIEVYDTTFDVVFCPSFNSRSHTTTKR